MQVFPGYDCYGERKRKALVQQVVSVLDAVSSLMTKRVIRKAITQKKIITLLHGALLSFFIPLSDCDLDVIIGFDVSDVGPGQNIFSSQRGLESRVESVLNRITQMQKISCSGNQAPSVRVAIMAQAQGGPVEGLDFSEYRPELLERFLDMRTRGPYYLRADTLRSYLSKFRSSPSGSTKVSQGQSLWGGVGQQS